MRLEERMERLGLTVLFMLVMLLFNPFFILSQESAWDFFFKDIRIKKVSENGAIIEWETSLPAQGMVKYGVNQSELFGISYDVSVKKSHSLNLGNLKKGTIYYFAIVASTKDHKIVSPVNQFRTEGIPDLDIIINQIIDITKDSAKIGWAFTQPVWTTLKYVEVPKTDYVEHKADKMDSSGTFILKKLKPDTSYYYVIEGKDEKGKSVKSPIRQFKTARWNKALSKKAEGTFIHYLEDDPYYDKKSPVLERITDGRLNYFNSMAVSGPVAKESQYVIIDLGQVRSVKAIEVYWRALSYSRDYALYTSRDKKNWEIVQEHIDAGTGQGIRGEKGSPIVYNRINCQKKARYVKMEVKKESQVFNKHKKWLFVQIMEIMVF
ncbi:MAG: discoidin domain-containing protein [Spirochaetes bacterium]|nr:discoidin domain-containing protein [Spirochaetota bacterium]